MRVPEAAWQSWRHKCKSCRQPSQIWCGCAHCCMCGGLRLGRVTHIFAERRIHCIHCVADDQAGDSEHRAGGSTVGSERADVNAGGGDRGTRRGAREGRGVLSAEPREQRGTNAHPRRVITRARRGCLAWGSACVLTVDVCCFCSRGSYVELSDRLNDKLDEATDLEMDLERARATALRWQEMALHSGTN